MRILQVNVRLSEGGAAQVARTLEIELEKLGHTTSFLYGYGKNGYKSKLHNPEKHFKFTSKLSAAINLIIFRIFGREIAIAPWLTKIRLQKILRKFDIIHLHVIHSYFLEYKILFDSIEKSGLPVVWTMHDQWIVTGRCALPGTCQLWRTGCKKCPDKKAYPPALIDHAARNFYLKKNTLLSTLTRDNFQLVSCASWLERNIKLAGFKNVVTVKNSVDSEFQIEMNKSELKPENSNLFICRDLRDRNKVDWDLLRQISEIPNQSLTIVGDNSPADLPKANFLPSTSDRSLIVSYYKSHKRLIFTSLVDAYPLTIMEALACGMDVYALKSFAAQEFEKHQNCFLFESPREMFEALVESIEIQVDLKASSGDELFDFTPKRMALEYEEIYKAIMNDVKRDE